MRFLLIPVLLTISLAGGPKYHGIPLPPGPPGTNRAIPGAWLIVDQRAIHATQGSYCFGPACVDLASPQALPAVASADVGGTSLVVVVRSRIRGASATISPWKGGHARRVSLSIGYAGHMAVLTLHVPQVGRNTLLRVFVRFPPRFHVTKKHVVAGDSTYFWHLNP